MNGWLIAVTAVAALLIGGIAGYLIYKLTHKPKPAEEGPLDKDILVKSGEQIKYNTRFLDLVAAELHDPQEKARLAELKEKLNFLSPSLKEEVHAIDEKIKAELEALEKKAAQGESIGDCKAIDRLLSERNLYTA